MVSEIVNSEKLKDNFLPQLLHGRQLERRSVAYIHLVSDIQAILASILPCISRRLWLHIGPIL